VPKSRRYRAACRATVARISKKPRTQFAPRKPVPVGQNTTTSSLGVLVDLALGLEHRFRQVVDEAAKEVEVARAAQALGELRGTLEVEEQEDAVLELRPMVDAGHEVPQDVGR
jgi:hypothetical protein